jgi:hypothetical protein
VHVGIDVTMSQADAQRLVDQEGQAVMAYLIGNDSWSDDSLVGVTETYERAWSGGLSAEFDAYIHWTTLNEDWEGTDEVYARVRLNDHRTGVVRTFEGENVVFDAHEN